VLPKELHDRELGVRQCWMVHRLASYDKLP